MAVLPSLEESFGNAIVEAMACGIPVITTNAGSIPEIITQNKNGIMIEPGNSHQLASDIENLLNNPEKRRSLGKSARETVVSKYSWESTAKRYLSIYSDLLDGQIVVDSNPNSGSVFSHFNRVKPKAQSKRQMFGILIGHYNISTQDIILKRVSRVCVF